MASQADHCVEISVLVPIKDECETVEELHRRLVKACDATGKPYEIIFIDDGSTDGSKERVREICTRDPRVRAVFLRRNFGKAAALQAGFDDLRGDLVFTIDGDLQDDPDEIPKFLEKMDEGYDLVSGWKVDRKDPASKRIPSKLFNWVITKTFGLALHDFNCGFKCYRREITQELNLYGELHRFIPVIAHSLGYRVAEVPVRHHPRQHGKSKYGAGRLLRGFFDFQTVMLTTRYFYRPLHFFGLIGVVTTALGVLILAYLSILWIMGTPIEARPLFFLGIFLSILGVQVTCTGLVAEMLAKIASSRGAPYSVMERIGTGLNESPKDSGAGVVSGE